VRLQYLNLFGVLVLGGFCVVQWRVNRDLNLEITRLERVRIEQLTQLEERDRVIQDYLADLDQFREQLSRVTNRLKETEGDLAATRLELAQLTQERDQLRISVSNWADAVAARDEQLEEAAGQLARFGADRNDAVTRFNELAEKHNEVIHELNDRTRQFNELVERYQKLAKP
jgi:methyl-accepting chemotaxis protein